ncbi:MAG: carotenoid biosynthesis protein [Alphaproteobacteria bacterium]|nr:carotenoid biosynthesis protein [Alphaproteobacteria bacterium]
MKAAWSWWALHAAAVAGAAFSLCVLIPYPHLWSHLPGAPQAYAFAMEHAGPLHILLGAAAALAYGRHALGWRPTLIFFGVSSALSLGMELLGTGTGWPFGAYAYTLGLGPKVLGRVPYSIPLSWFYLGFVSWLLARELVRRHLGRPSAVLEVALGTWLLLAWDLVLDPAMAHPDLPVRFWRWHERGAYIGMPLVNLVGWLVTGAAFMGVARAWIGGGADRAPADRRFLLALYGTNLAFGAVLCASLGLVAPIVLALVAGLLPALSLWWGADVDPQLSALPSAASSRGLSGLQAQEPSSR